MRALVGIALAAALWVSPAATFAAEGTLPAEAPDDTLVFGLTATQLALAAGVGASAGVAGALASGNVIAGAFGTLAAIYVAHIAVEAAFYYWWPWEAWPWEAWPWEAEPETPAARTSAIRRGAGDRDAFSTTPLRLSPRR